MGARARRPWYKKKTNWAAFATVLSSGVAAYPPTMVVGIVLLGMSRAFAGWATSDRAGKPNENITDRKRTPKPIKYVMENAASANEIVYTHEPINVNITEE